MVMLESDTRKELPVSGGSEQDGTRMVLIDGEGTSMATH